MSIDLSKITYSQVSTNLSTNGVLIYGAPKIGKTTLASKFDGAFFLATEPGQNYVSVRKLFVTDWKQVLEFGQALQTQKNHGIKTVIIDIADLFYKLCEKHVSDLNNVSHPSDMPYGKGFSLTRDEFVRVITKLNSTGVGLVFLSHAQEKTMKTKSAEWTTMATTLSGTAEKIISGYCDQILYCYKDDEGKRVMRTEATKYILAGDRSGLLPSVMPMDFDLLQGYLSKTVNKTKTQQATQTKDKELTL